MIILLPTSHFAAIGNPMRGRFVSLFVLLAILFGGIVVPATAHAEDAMAAHGSEMFAVFEHADDADHGDDHQDTGDQPCQVVTHHHCSMALAVDGSLLTLSSMLRDANISGLKAASMSSLSQAPPTEPPAA